MAGGNECMLKGSRIGERFDKYNVKDVSTSEFLRAA